MSIKPTFLSFLLGLLAVFPLASLAKVLTSINQVKKQYDFVIVGGGTAGSVLANRLSENRDVSVLVVEAGDNNVGNVNLEIPFLGVALPGTNVDWNYTTTPQAGFNGRSIPYARGFVLGGSSSINLLSYHRGSDDIWNRWADISGDDGWNWRSIEKYYMKSSRLVPPADGRDVRSYVDPRDHGYGPIEVSVPGFPLPIDDIVLTSAKRLGGRFAFNDDFNGGNFLGIGYMQSTVGEGERSSGATAYLNPVFDRSNLDVLVNTRVTKLINTARPPNSTPALNKVELAQSSNGPRHQVLASKEVILAAGVIGTPQILQLSGVGNKNTLRALGIPSVADLPEVGENLADHPLLANYFEVQSNGTWDDVLRNGDVFGQTMGRWQAERQGLFVDSPGNTVGFFKVPSGSPALRGIQDPSSGSKSPHTELIFVDGFAQFGSVAQPAEGNFVTVLSAVVSPTSRGSVKIVSADPFASPRINPNFFGTNFDVLAMVQAINDAVSFMSAPLWQQVFKPTPFGDLATAKTDAAKADFARLRSVNINHPVGTAKMSAKGGVVDAKLKVKGVDGLRVVDASIFPVIPECHPQALVYIIAERAADLIKSQHRIQ
ncbi:aryl-alcohol-oxidase from pleurotus Eryingii [Cristinia sonorae]|uniref:Aryl-alcohol-oxidase from pleurotus Eryingii n=1 Tax=Cristinia sonorae TaxID=1940300 RepID=A0A8K0UG28_9AGAR|nr:aryl-alcohol-oxidase from pleurotus Eryingii [Cristinia sonorae]